MAGSVNGTDVLAAMFEDAGHEVYTRHSLVTSDMQAADIVVWFPDDRQAPRKEVCDWFDEWLTESPGRTLILVGRDFDAEPQYWEFHYKRKLGESAQAGDADAPAVEERKDDEKAAEEAKSSDEKKEPSAQTLPDAADPADLEKDADAESGKAKEKPSSNCRWFAYEPGDEVTVQQLFGPWAAGIDPAETRIEVETRLVPKGDYEVLLDSEVGPLVSRLRPPYSSGSQIILVENGSFLLNLPLINHQHRMLAGELVAVAGDSGSVVFLESRPGGPPIDPPPSDSSLWTLFQGWPLGAILLQLAIAGIIFCFAHWPIFGRPKQPPGAPTTDFSYHVAAVGEMLSKTRDPRLTHPPESTPASARSTSPTPRAASSMFK
jgi:hypothetical protein